MRRKGGPDPNFPYLAADVRFRFPDPLKAEGDVVCAGGNLSPGMLLSAYRQGLFPWFNEGDPVIWQSPDPRFVIFPENLHISASMRKTLRQGRFEISFDRSFGEVIAACSSVPRPGQDGTWITADMIAAYTELHRLGFAVSAEARLDGRLAGGCYGVRIGRVFAGESMFAAVPNASKAAFLRLAQRLFADGVAFIDCQVYSEHLASMGGTEISRADFISLLRGL